MHRRGVFFSINNYLWKKKIHYFISIALFEKLRKIIPMWTSVIHLLISFLQRKFKPNKSRNLSKFLKNKNRNLSQIQTNLHLHSKSSNQESNFTKKKRIKNWPKLYNRTNYTSICKLSYMRSFIQLFSLILAKRPRNVFFFLNSFSLW